ncbi:Rab-like GTPase [Bodo saltans virus]|uniref:Rab-like GTPase n=1 Tax=Bodo saltans virus TaxID=2024608 RepID=A0A2H4UVB9_9VIRU|nr:Rab-like GTPase [Bodo saltans virus]ATZ80809.1 Rab-like GTPase [Bodo saltans virus]
MYYYNKSSTDTTIKKPYKICIVGDSGNGKSSIINKFVYNEFSYNNSNTMGVDYKSKIIDVKGKKLKFGIWDTAGQERFRSIVPAFFKDAHGIILSYDMTNIQSFHNLESWIREIKNVVNIDDISLILIATKCDLQFKNVPFKDVAAFIEKYNLKHLETSARYGKNIDTLFNTFAEQIVEKCEINEKNNSNINTHINTNNKIGKPPIAKTNNGYIKNCCFY